jgi:dipeptidyl aminopeptidase/acylaminoacyl peptidase
VASLLSIVVAFVGCGPEPESVRLELLPLTLENIHRHDTGARQVALSPNGEFAAVVATGPDGPGIYLLPTSGAGNDAAVHFWESASSPDWSLDGARIAFIRSGEVWTVAPPGAEEPVQITTDVGDARAPVLSPDGATVAFYSGRSGHQDIWTVRTDGQGSPRQLTSGAMALDDRRFQPAWAPDGRTIAYVSNESDYWHDDVWLVDTDTGSRRQLSRSLMASSSPVWSPSGDRIAVFGTAKNEYWYEDLSYIYVLDPGRGDARILPMEVFASDMIMRHRPFWTGDGQVLLFPYMQRGDYDVWAVPASGGVATRVTHMGGAMPSFHATPDGRHLAFVRSGPSLGSEVYYVPAQGGSPRQISDFAPRWADLTEPIEVSFESFDGLRIQAFLFRPPEVGNGQRCPALVQVHGGGTNSYLKGLNLTEQYLASRGFVVLAINYRGGSGFGRGFQDLGVEDWLNGQALDAGAAADFLRELPFATGRVGIYGGSYGGSMSLAAATRTPNKFDAAVPMRGAYSKTQTLEYTDRLGQIFTVTGHGGTPDERPETYAKSNTVERIQNLAAPVLLMHGALDRRVPIQHFDLAVAELEKHGKEFETKVYPEEGHGFRNPENRIDMYQRLEDFFRLHLGACEAL